MPSLNKRINLTVPDVLYEKIQEFKEKNGITCDATACLQLVTKQLKAEENMAAVTQAFLQFTPEQVAAISADGAKTIRERLDRTNIKP